MGREVDAEPRAIQPPTFEGSICSWVVPPTSTLLRSFLLILELRFPTAVRRERWTSKAGGWGWLPPDRGSGAETFASSYQSLILSVISHFFKISWRIIAVVINYGIWQQSVIYHEDFILLTASGQRPYLSLWISGPADISSEVVAQLKNFLSLVCLEIETWTLQPSCLLIISETRIMLGNRVKISLRSKRDLRFSMYREKTLRHLHSSTATKSCVIYSLLSWACHPLLALIRSELILKMSRTITISPLSLIYWYQTLTIVIP